MQKEEASSVYESGHSAEWETGGVVANMLPKQGGNRFSGGFFTNYASERTQSNNFTDELKARGLTAALPTKEIRDKFSFDVKVMPLPDANDFRVSLGDAEKEEITFGFFGLTGSRVIFADITLPLKAHPASATVSRRAS